MCQVHLEGTLTCLGVMAGYRPGNRRGTRQPAALGDSHKVAEPRLVPAGAMWSVPPPIAVAAAAAKAVARSIPSAAWGLVGHLKGTVDERPAYTIIVAAIAVAAGIIVAVVFARRRLGYSPVAGADVTPLADTEPVTADVTPRTDTEPVTASAATALDTSADQRVIGAAMVISIVTAAASGMCAVESAHAVWRRAPHPVRPHFLEAVGSGIVAVASLIGCYLAYLRVPSTPAAQDSGSGACLCRCCAAERSLSGSHRRCRRDSGRRARYFGQEVALCRTRQTSTPSTTA
jgi:hypothetical protein